MSNGESRGTASGGDCSDTGSGTPLLLLHGIGGTWQIWKPVLAALSRHHRVLAPTLPGHCGGPACTGSGDPTVAGIADQLIAMMRARGIESAHVAGNSLGGWLSLELARRGFARSVTVFSPAGGWRTRKDYRAVANSFHIFHALMWLMKLLVLLLAGFAGARRFLGRQTMEHADRMPAGEFKAALWAMSGAPALFGLLRTMEHDGPVQPLAAQVPVRVAWSERDAVIPYERYGLPLIERVAGAEVTIVPGVGHVPMYDDPDAVAASILAVTARAEAAEAAGAGAAGRTGAAA